MGVKRRPVFEHAVNPMFGVMLELACIAGFLGFGFLLSILIFSLTR